MPNDDFLLMEVDRLLESNTGSSRLHDARVTYVNNPSEQNRKNLVDAMGQPESLRNERLKRIMRKLDARGISPRDVSDRDKERQRKLDQGPTRSAFDVDDEALKRQRGRDSRKIQPSIFNTEDQLTEVPDPVNAGDARTDKALRDANFGPDVDELNRKILEAANGKPAEHSITRERSESNSLAKIIRNMFMQLITSSQDSETSSDGTGTESGGGNAQKSKPADAKPKKTEAEPQASNTVSRDDFTDLTKSINLLAGKVNV